MRFAWLVPWLVEIIYALISCATCAAAAEWHVATNGTATGDGSAASPWNLATAFKHPVAIKAGDTVLLHGGHYYLGAMNSGLAGAAGMEIVVRSAPGEWAVLDTLVGPGSADVGQLGLYGGYTIYLDFEVTCTSSRSRVSTIPGSFPWDQGAGGNVYRGAISVNGPAIHIANLIIHDLSNGVFSGHTAIGGSVYGCQIYNIGWDAPDRGHGHATYSQNNGTAPKVIELVTAINSYDDSLNFYGSSASFLKNLRCVNCTAFGARGRNLAFTGECVIGGAEIIGNILASGGKEDTLAVNSPAPYGKIGDDVKLADNLIFGAFRFGQGFYSSTITNNTIIGGRDTRFIDFIRVANSKAVITGQKYHEPGSFMLNSVSTTLAQWQAAGYDPGVTIQPAIPADSIVVRPNKYDPGRRHVTILNWSKSTSANVPTGLSAGAIYEVRSAYDPAGAPVSKGTIGTASDSISIPLGTVAAPIPISATSPVSAADIRFQAFVITSTAGPVTPEEPPPKPGKKKLDLYRDADGKLYTSDDGGLTFKLLEVR